MTVPNKLPIAVVILCCQMLGNGCHTNEQSTSPTNGDYSIPPEVEEKGEALVKKGRLDAAVHLLHPYAEKGNPDAQWGMAFLMFEEDDKSPKNRRALDWVRKAASQGHEQALELLSNSYRWGHFNLPTNRVMAEMWHSSVTDTNRIQECFRYERSILSGKQ